MPLYADNRVPNRVIVSLITGKEVYQTTMQEMCELAGHLLGMPVNAVSLEAVHWICDRSLRRLFTGSSIADLPAYPADAKAVSDWMGQNSFVHMNEHRMVKPLRVQLDDASTAFIDTEALLKLHPIALIDLLTFLEQLNDPGFVSRVLDNRALLGEMPSVDYSKIAADLAAFSVRVTNRPLRDWVSELARHAQDLRQFVGLVDALNQADKQQLHLGRRPAVLPHERVVSLLVGDLQGTQTNDAHTKAAAVYARLGGVAPQGA